MAPKAAFMLLCQEGHTACAIANGLPAFVVIICMLLAIATENDQVCCHGNDWCDCPLTLGQFHPLTNMDVPPRELEKPQDELSNYN